jgi:hypothetical protein
MGAALAVAVVPAVAVAVAVPTAPVPTGFKAASVTWVSPQQGWVLGAARCGTKTCTDVIATTDGGSSWHLAGVVPAPIPQIGQPGTGVTEIRFATAAVGWAFGPGLYRTATGGRTWAAEPVPGGGKQILSLATTPTGTYAVVSPCAFGTGLCSRQPLSLWRTATLTGPSWTQVGVSLPANDVADVAAYHATVYVVDAQRDVTGLADKFYASTDGIHFAARPVPCDRQPDIALAQAVPTSATHVALLCVGDLGSPQPGDATKYAYRSGNTGLTDTYAGAMPVLGVRAQLAASPTGNLAAISANGGSFIYINDSLKTTWTTAVFFGDGGRYWNDILYVTGSKGWVIYSPVSYFHGLGKIYVTTDSGHHWNLITP